MDNWLHRTELLIGSENITKLQNAHVVVFGCGGVGSYTIEALVRSGIGTISIVDHDMVDITNINRQLIADTSTIGSLKIEAEKERLLRINPSLTILTYSQFADASNLNQIISSDCQYIVDAIDSVSSKLALAQYAFEHHIPIISCMGTGNKLNPTLFEVTDITKTSVCPLAKVMRKELKQRGIPHLKVVYSKEEPHRFSSSLENSRTPASISFVPSVAGLILASEVIKDLISI